MLLDNLFDVLFDDDDEKVERKTTKNGFLIEFKPCSQLFFFSVNCNQCTVEVGLKPTTNAPTNASTDVPTDVTAGGSNSTDVSSEIPMSSVSPTADLETTTLAVETSTTTIDEASELVNDPETFFVELPTIIVNLPTKVIEPTTMAIEPATKFIDITRKTIHKNTKSMTMKEKVRKRNYPLINIFN